MAASVPFPPDWRAAEPWLTPMTLGVRRGFTWDASYLRPIRLHFWIAYWNPGPGAAVVVDGRRHPCGPEAVLLIPGENWFQRQQSRPFDHWWSHFRCAGSPGRAGAWAIPSPAGSPLRLQLERAWDAAWRHGSSHPATLAAGHAAIALAVAGVDWAAPASGLEDAAVAGLLDWLAAQGLPALGTEALARRLDMHPKSFCRRFRQAVGTTAQDWLRQRRLEVAAERLAAGDSVEAAATAAGYADPFHFSRLFRRYRGVPPTHYRRMAGD
ncbi:MAG: helix-turn-helix transcriptional regulator [Planctomycetes bacterium]|nr:helix-turn-helix transcriptional regulator [Planctomycetota bacterium]